MHLPNYMYTVGPLMARNQRHARKLFREFLEVKRLPNGTEVYE